MGGKTTYLSDTLGLTEGNTTIFKQMCCWFSQMGQQNSWRQTKRTLLWDFPHESRDLIIMFLFLFLDPCILFCHLGEEKNSPNELPAHFRALREHLEIHFLAQGCLSGAVTPSSANRTSIFCLRWGLIVQTGTWTKNPLFLRPVPSRLSYHLHHHIPTSVLIIYSYE